MTPCALDDIDEENETITTPSVSALRNTAIRYFVSCAIGLVLPFWVTNGSVPVGMQPLLAAGYPLLWFVCYFSGIYFLVRTKDVHCGKWMSGIVAVFLLIVLEICIVPYAFKISSLIFLPVFVLMALLIVAFLPRRVETRVVAYPVSKTVPSCPEEHNGIHDDTNARIH